jgi:outer membrane scaffolding protein for murein synthesis (MipA/OmpV family)
MAATPAIGRHLSRMCAALLVTAASMRASATQEPLWEYGLGAGAVALNDYTGAGSSHVYPVPWGYLVYNGKFLKADRDGVRGLFVDQKWIEINMSANLTAPVRNNAARAGMPELRSTVQLGPSLDLHLYRSENSRVKLDLNLPVRAAVTIEAQPKDIGWVFAPNLDIDIRDVFNRKGWNLGLEAGPEFADAHYHELFLFGFRAICAADAAGLRGPRRLFRHAILRGDFEALSQVSLRRLPALRYPRGREFRRQPARRAAA